MYRRKDDTSGLYGYWGRNRWIIEPQFAYAHNFESGYAAVDLEDKRFGLITTDGTFHSLDSLCNGRTPIREEYSSISFLDWNEEPSSYATVCTKDGRKRQWGMIETNLSYTPLTEKVFAQATRVEPCGEHLVIVRSNGRGKETSKGLFNLRDMRLELPCEYSCIYPPKGSEKGSIGVVSRPMRDVHNKRDDAFYDVTKREIISDWFLNALPHSHGFGAICEREHGGNGWYFVDESLQPVFDRQFDGVDRFSQGLAGVYIDDDAGFIDTTGQMRLLLPHYVDMKPFNEYGLTIANRNSLDWDLDIIDRKGQVLAAGFQTAVYWEGDFPYFEVSSGGKRGWDGEEQFLDMNLNRIY